MEVDQPTIALCGECVATPSDGRVWWGDLESKKYLQKEGGGGGRGLCEGGMEGEISARRQGGRLDGKWISPREGGQRSYAFGLNV